MSIINSQLHLKQRCPLGRSSSGFYETEYKYDDFWDETKHLTQQEAGFVEIDANKKQLEKWLSEIAIKGSKKLTYTFAVYMFCLLYIL